MQSITDNAARKWLAEAALHQIDEMPTADAHNGTRALTVLLAGTPSAARAAKLHELTEQQALAAKAVLQSLDDDEQPYP